MNRLTPTITAALFVTAVWLPRTAHVPFVGPALLHAQQSAKAKSSDADSDQDMNGDDDDDDASPVAHSAHGPDGPRTVDVGRMLRPGRSNSTLLHVNVAYGTGTLSVAPVAGPWLYNVHLTYTPGQQGVPRIMYNPTANILDVHGNSQQNGDINLDFDDHHHHSDSDNELQLGLDRGVPLDLSLKFGMGDVTAQLGGLSLEHLKVKTDAADARISFDSPDPVPLNELDVEIGAAAFHATGLGNARVQHIDVHAAAGVVDLDFGGHWTNDATLELNAALGAIHIHVPSGVVVDAPTGQKFLGSMNNSAGGATTPQTPGGPIYHLHVVPHAALGKIEIDRQTE